MFNRILVFCFSIAVFFPQVKAQDAQVDSMIALLKTCKNDTLKLHILNSIAEQSTDDKVWPVYNMEMQRLSLKLMKSKNHAIRKRGIYHYGNSLLNLGFLYLSKGRLSYALTYFLKGYEMMKKMNDPIGMAAAMNNAGYVYKSLGDIPKALDCYHESLRLYESVKHEKGIGNTINNLAVLYNKQGNVNEAIQLNLRSLQIAQKRGDKLSMGISMNNLALLYQQKKGYKIAYDYLNNALRIQEEIDDKEGIANSHNNIGCLLEDEKKLGEALTEYEKAYALLQTINDQSVLVSTIINLGSLYLKLGNVNKAHQYASEAYELAKKIKYIDELSDAADLLSKVYKQKNMYKEALEMHEYFMKMRDSALNESTKSATMKMQARYEYEKKAAADSLKNLQSQKLKDAEIRVSKTALKHEKDMKYVLFGGLALMIAFAIYVFNRYKNSKEKNRIIAFQKALVDEKQKEIIDSMHYAKRIQESLLPSEKYIDRNVGRLKK